MHITYIYNIYIHTHTQKNSLADGLPCGICITVFFTFKIYVYCERDGLLMQFIIFPVSKFLEDLMVSHSYGRNMSPHIM